MALNEHFLFFRTLDLGAQLKLVESGLSMRNNTKGIIEGFVECIEINNEQSIAEHLGFTAIFARLGKTVRKFNPRQVQEYSKSKLAQYSVRLHAFTDFTPLTLS